MKCVVLPALCRRNVTGDTHGPHEEMSLDH